MRFTHHTDPDLLRPCLAEGGHRERPLRPEAVSPIGADSRFSRHCTGGACLWFCGDYVSSKSVIGTANMSGLIEHSLAAKLNQLVNDITDLGAKVRGSWPYGIDFDQILGTVIKHRHQRASIKVFLQ